MPPKRAPCQICEKNESKYACSKCMVLYCSVPCFKQHKEFSCSASARASSSAASYLDVGSNKSEADVDQRQDPDSVAPNETPLGQTNPSLRPLTSLKWPYIPEESAYPDPLKRDDPKQLQLYQYESIATSQAVRKALSANPKLPELLRSIDKLRGEDREEALQRALDVAPADLTRSSRRAGAYSEEDIRGFRDLAEAVEAAVRGGKEDVLGLNWGD